MDRTVITQRRVTVVMVNDSPEGVLLEATPEAVKAAEAVIAAKAAARGWEGAYIWSMPVQVIERRPETGAPAPKPEPERIP
jgi:hypothetical protein